MSSRFLRHYVFSTDHKVIAKQYLFTGFIMALIGGWMAYGIRATLAWPKDSLPGFGVMDPGRYNALVTLHGSIMVFWVAMPILLAAFGNFLIPLMIGAKDMAFPGLNMLSYWTFFLSSVVLVTSFFAQGGPANSGWTAYPPLSANAAFTGVGLGLDLWLLALALEFASFLMGGVNFLATTLTMRAEGMSLMRLPLVVWMQGIASVIFMLSVGPIIAGAVMLLLDRNLGAGFFLPDKGGDPLLWQHLFWFFGHPEVYVILLPSLGLVAEVLTVHARKPIFGYTTILISTFAAGILSFVVWAHHQFVSGMNVQLALPFSLLTVIISVPFAVILFAFIATLYKGSIRLTAAMCFALGMIAMFLIGGCTGIPLGSLATDIYLHDTYFVVGHFHYTLFSSVIFGMFAAIYHWYPKMFGRMLSEPLGKLHFWLVLTFFNMTFIPHFFLGLAGHPRRYANPTGFNLPFSELHSLQVLSTVGAIGLLLSQIPFVLNLAFSFFRGRRASANPWAGATLEWIAPSPPGHGNFPAEVKVVRGPYEYSPTTGNGDFLPQGELISASKP